MELLELEMQSSLIEKFSDVVLPSFYTYYIFSDLKNLIHSACQIHVMFFSTYLYVHFVFHL